MKRNTLFYFFSVMLCCLLSCQQDDIAQPVTGKATFAMSIRAEEGGRAKGSPIPVAVLLSVERDNGIVKEMKLSLFAFGENYVSKNVEMTTGSYKLTKFLILDASDRAVYATPLKDSEFAEYVTTPLPIDFSITENEATEIVPQVLSVQESADPTRFGYASFGFEVSSAVKKITLDGISVQDTLTLYYENGKIGSTEWCSHLTGDIACAAAFTETRRYNESGKLDSLGGRFNASYSYEENVLKKIVASKIDSTGSNQPFSTTTFLKYDGQLPTQLRVEFATGTVSHVELTFNATGDLTHKVIKNADGQVVEDVQISYSTTLNTLRRKLESPSFAVLFFGYDDLAFYYSHHVPETLTILYSNTPIVPKNLIIRYTITEDAGKLTSARAYRDDINVHNITVAYAK